MHMVRGMNRTPATLHLPVAYPIAILRLKCVDDTESQSIQRLHRGESKYGNYCLRQFRHSQNRGIVIVTATILSVCFLFDHGATSQSMITCYSAHLDHRHLHQRLCGHNILILLLLQLRCRSAKHDPKAMAQVK